jgi:hypothetical protein
MTRMMCFSPDEGLPGRTWASGAPVLIRPVEGSEFRRSHAVRLAGLRCTVALPIFREGRFTSIVVLLFGESAPHRGTVEVWRDDPTQASGIVRVDAHYGTEADATAARSRPNGDRDSASIRLFDDGCALSLPCKSPDGCLWTVELVASKARPIALRMEIWSAAGVGPGMARTVGWCSTGGVLPAGEAGARPAGVLGPIDDAGRTGVAWAGRVRREGAASGADVDPVFPFDHVLAIPITRPDGATDVVALHF